MSTSFLDKHHFLLRRLHSLAGIVPIGVFLINHLLTNSSLVWGKFALRGEGGNLGIQEGGAAYFQKEVTWINEQIPHLYLIELTLIGAIVFHSVLGVYYARSGKSNTERYAYQANWRYKLQRISGYIGILFIAYHVATLRFGLTFLMPGGKPWDQKFAASTLNEALLGGGIGWDLGLGLLYVVGVSLLVFHFANGLWTAAITWGLTVSQKAQQRWGVVCGGLGAALMLMAWASIFGAMTLDPAKAKAVESKHAVGSPAARDSSMRDARPGSRWLQEPYRPRTPRDVTESHVTTVVPSGIDLSPGPMDRSFFARQALSETAPAAAEDRPDARKAGPDADETEAGPLLNEVDYPWPGTDLAVREWGEWQVDHPPIELVSFGPTTDPWIEALNRIELLPGAAPIR